MSTTKDRLEWLEELSRRHEDRLNDVQITALASILARLTAIENKAAGTIVTADSPTMLKIRLDSLEKRLTEMGDALGPALNSISIVKGKLAIVERLAYKHEARLAPAPKQPKLWRLRAAVRGWLDEHEDTISWLWSWAVIGLAITAGFVAGFLSR